MLHLARFGRARRRANAPRQPQPSRRRAAQQRRQRRRPLTSCSAPTTAPFCGRRAHNAGRKARADRCFLAPARRTTALPGARQEEGWRAVARALGRRPCPVSVVVRRSPTDICRCIGAVSRRGALPHSIPRGKARSFVRIVRWSIARAARHHRTADISARERHAIGRERHGANRHGVVAQARPCRSGCEARERPAWRRRGSQVPHATAAVRASGGEQRHRGGVAQRCC